MFKVLIMTLLIFSAIGITILYLAMCKAASKADELMDKYWEEKNNFYSTTKTREPEKKNSENRI